MPIFLRLLAGLAIAGTLVFLFNKIWTTIDWRFKLVINALVGLALFLLVLDCVSDFFGWGWFDGVHASGVRRR